MFDNALEMLTLTGRSLAARDDDDDPGTLGRSRIDERGEEGFLRVSLLFDGAVGWSGSIAFTDGIRIGAVLDRNGLRPSRYYVTKDGLW